MTPLDPAALLERVKTDAAQDLAHSETCDCDLREGGDTCIDVRQIIGKAIDRAIRVAGIVGRIEQAEKDASLIRPHTSYFGEGGSIENVDGHRCSLMRVETERDRLLAELEKESE